ncbi:MAG: PQQ-dependent sugar dehydrogenase [Gemmatimonadetes bacterium]|nr:PQQ-dependent sugar dehydrogenase [Gemmatimonadota bacterium]
MKQRCLILIALSCVACENRPDPVKDPVGAEVQTGTIRLEEVAQVSSPVFLTSPPGDARLFVLEQAGRIRVVEDGQLLATPFLDISSKVGSGGERGLLGLAFHPAYASNGYFFVNYTDRNGDTRIERYRASADRNRADPGSVKRLLSIDQPYANHNGGMLEFGADGMLYIGMGDGGSGGDPLGNGQKLSTLLGKLLRIDVDRGDPYGIPAGNPFVGRAGARGEIWAYGLRNPWRFAFDHAGGNLYVADVGQNALEEITVVASASGGVNYGWNRMEGARCFRAESCDRGGLQIPQVDYPRSDGCSVTGGYVYRGRRIPNLVGHYFYADYCRPGLRSFHSSPAVTDQRLWDLPQATQVSSFGQDSEGELYVLSHGGRVFKIVPG